MRGHRAREDDAAAAMPHRAQRERTGAEGEEGPEPARRSFRLVPRQRLGARGDRAGHDVHVGGDDVLPLREWERADRVSAVGRKPDHGQAGREADRKAQAEAVPHPVRG